MLLNRIYAKKKKNTPSRYHIDNESLINFFVCHYTTVQKVLGFCLPIYCLLEKQLSKPIGKTRRKQQHFSVMQNAGKQFHRTTLTRLRSWQREAVKGSVEGRNHIVGFALKWTLC